MEQIKAKVQELLAMNAIEPEYTYGSKSENSLNNIMKRQDVLIKEIKAIARTNNTLLGRTVRFPMADSYAVYVVTKVNAKTVQVTWIRYCDAWQDDRLGEKGSISKEFAQSKIDFDDMWENHSK